MPRDRHRYAAELLGTFTLVFVGTTSVVGAGRANAPSCWPCPSPSGSRCSRASMPSARSRAVTSTRRSLAAIPFSGCSVNPARTLGPDLVGGTWTGVWISFVAPPLGAVIAWIVHANVVRGGLPMASEAPVAEVLGEAEGPAGAPATT